MTPEVAAELIGELHTELAKLTALPVSNDSIERDIENTASALVEITALDAGVTLDYNTIRELARRVAGIRPDQTASLVDVVTQVIGTVAVRAARRTGRPVAEHVDLAADEVMARLAEVDRDAFDWVTAALTAAD